MKSSKFECRIRSVEVVCTTRNERTRVLERTWERLEGKCGRSKQVERIERMISDLLARDANPDWYLLLLRKGKTFLLLLLAWMRICLDVECRTGVQQCRSGSGKGMQGDCGCKNCFGA